LIVIDSSAFVDSILSKSAADRLAVIGAANQIAVPDIFYVEVASAVRKLESLKLLVRDQAEEALQCLVDLKLDVYPTKELVKQIWDHRHFISAYDTAYVAVAVNTKSPLVTHDDKLAKAVGGFLKTSRLIP
jgi:predicted nucleic acid-binding protein